MNKVARRALGAGAAALALLACGAAEAAEPLLKMDAATQARLGIMTAPLQAAFRGATQTGFARALDPVPLAQLESDLQAAEAAAAASQAEAARTRALNAADQTVSKQAAEAAAAQARADAAKLQLLRRRVGLEWSPVLARWPNARLSKLVGDIAAGRAALVRIDAASGLAQAHGAAILDLGPAGPVRAAILGATRTGDMRLQSTGLLALVSGRQAALLGAGTVTPATVGDGAGASGVVLPRAALLRSGGRTWVWIRRDATDFERREAPPGQADPAGLFVTAGFRPGEPVVVAGASQLFAAQTNARSGGDKGE
ncbi:MAG TPA: hypothetical protein VGC92_04705 [Phenylobacterium sp.]|jgi:hypothetical protein